GPDLAARLAQKEQAADAKWRQLLEIIGEERAFRAGQSPDTPELLDQLRRLSGAGAGRPARKPLLVEFLQLPGDRYVVFLAPLWQDPPPVEAIEIAYSGEDERPGWRAKGAAGPAGPDPGRLGDLLTLWDRCV